MVDFEDRETLKSQRKTPWSNGKDQQNVTTNSTFVWSTNIQIQVAQLEKGEFVYNLDQ